MNWLITLFQEQSVAHSMLVLALVIAAGLAVGSIRIFGVSLGAAGVVFAGILVGHLGVTVNHEVLEFMREFGLVFFVFMIGLQVGPGFFASLKQQGLPMNLMAAAVVLLGAGIAVLHHFLADVPVPAAAGLFSGSTTNTPSLAAAGEALRQTPGVTDDVLKLPGLAYAVTYPFGILGTILAMLVIRKMFRVDLDVEKRSLREREARRRSDIQTLALKVTNANLAGVAVGEIPGLKEAEAVVSRVARGGVAEIARPEFRLQLGDVILVVAPSTGLEKLRMIVGEPSAIDVRRVRSDITARRVLVTSRGALGKTADELDLIERFSVALTRVARGDQQFTPTPGLRLQFGDTVTLVGPEVQLDAAEKVLGNSPKALNHPNLAPIFVGVLFGVLLGSLPLALPGLPAPVKLGLAGGPLVVAILLSRIGHWGPLVWYMAPNANLALREIGIALFLACVGLKSGDSFVRILSEGDGIRWMLLGAAITFVPLLLVGIWARLVAKLNYVALCGLMAGSMTDPPALAFATTLSGTEEVAVSYVTVYPLTMILRVFAAQVMVLVLM